MLVACGGGSSGSSPTGPSPGGGGTPTESFASIQSQVFVPRCVQCHGSSRREQNLDLQNNAYNNLVNRQSTQVNMLLVSPGNPDASYLIHKIEGRPGIVGSQMPQAMTPLTGAQIDAIRRWIQNGAPNN